LQAQVKKNAISTEALNEIIIDSIQDVKGKNIAKLDLRALNEAPTDFFIICEGESSTQVKAIADRIHKRVKDEGGTLPTHYEGQNSTVWVCLDYFTTVVHVFYKDARKFYELDELWSDAKTTVYDSL